MRRRKNFSVYLAWIFFLAFVIYVGVDMFSNQKNKDTEPANLSFAPTLQATAAQAPLNTTVISVRLDGRGDGHLPELLPNEMSEAYPNGVGGYNWALPHTATGEEARGITADGIFFIKESLLLEAGMSEYAEIMCDATAWSPAPLKRVEWPSGIVYIYQL